MSKGAKRSVLFTVIVIIVFAVISFLMPVPKNAVFWTSVGFMVLALITMAYVIITAFGDGPSAKSRFYGFPIAKVGASYLVVQLLVSSVFILCAKWIPVWPVVVTSLILFVIAAVGIVATESVRDEIVRQDNKLQADTSCMSTLRSIVYPLASQCNDQTAINALKKLADEFRYSDPVSSDSLKPVEQELEGLVEKLQMAVSTGKTDEIIRLCNDISRVLSERNRLCKLNKGR